MSVALLMARVANPRKQKKLSVWSLWLCRGVWHTQDGEVQEKGSKVPSAVRRRKRPFRRGRRGSRGGARPVRRGKLPDVPTHPEKASRRERGSGSRTSHFVASFERAAERLVKTSKACLDIKRRGLERQREGKVPLPPRAAAGLDRRQSSIRHASAFWGDAHAKVFSVPRAQGRRCWRELLHRLADVAHDEDVSSFGDNASVIMSELAAIEEEEKPPFPGLVRGLYGGWTRPDAAISAGSQDWGRLQRTPWGRR